jgi:hypothetical protein
VLVYRIEREYDRQGPFNGQGSGVYDRAADRDGHRSCHRKPGPYIDMEEGSEEGSELRLKWRQVSVSDYRFGFATKNQLIEWFSSPAGRSALQEQGYQVTRLRVPRSAVLKGNYQVAFDCNRAVTCGTNDLVTLKPN